MAHYAFLDNNNIVTEVIIGIDESDGDWETKYSKIRGQVCKRTSFNTQKGKHLKGGVPFRGNYAGVGYKYDQKLDAFIPPKPFESWILNKDSYCWDPPVPIPGSLVEYEWNENTISWKKR